MQSRTVLSRPIGEYTGSAPGSLGLVAPGAERIDVFYNDLSSPWTFAPFLSAPLDASVMDGRAIHARLVYDLVYNPQATRLLRDMPVADLTIEDPPIEDVNEHVFASDGHAAHEREKRADGEAAVAAAGHSHVGSNASSDHDRSFGVAGASRDTRDGTGTTRPVCTYSPTANKASATRSCSPPACPTFGTGPRWWCWSRLPD